MEICENCENCPGMKNYNKLIESLRSMGNKPAEKKFKQLMEKHMVEYCSSKKRDSYLHRGKIEKRVS
jgi:hypothetical protein